MMAGDNITRHVVLAIHGRHAQAILNGEKTHELRRRLPTIAEGDYVWLYETAPQSAIVGGFVVGGVSRRSPTSIWADMGSGFAITKNEFDDYVAGAAEVVAIEVGESFRLRRPSAKQEMAGVGSGFTPPQSVTVLHSRILTVHLERLCWSAARANAAPSQPRTAR